MVRESKAQDWSLTWSPKENVETLPEVLRNVFESPYITRCYAIAEFSEKWHIHAGFSTYRCYNSDYFWWKPICDADEKLQPPALEIRYHNNIYGLVGGYCAKTENVKILFRKGFTDEQLDAGRDIHIRGLRKQRIRKTLDKYHIITPDKFEVAVGTQMAELECSQSEAILALARDGFAFARSVKGLTVLYADIETEMRELES